MKESALVRHLGAERAVYGGEENEEGEDAEERMTDSEEQDGLNEGDGVPEALRRGRSGGMLTLGIRNINIKQIEI
jgi:hypothetical protein